MYDISFTPFPVLSTSRLTLRQLTDADAMTVSSLRSDEAVNKYIDRPGKATPDDALVFIQKVNAGIHLNAWIYWAVCLQGCPDLIGTICLWNFSEDKTRAEVGYELLPAYQKQGLMDEALKQVLQYGFETIHLITIDAFIHAQNESSIRLLTKNHFHPAPDKKDDQNPNYLVYTLHHRTWEKGNHEKKERRI